MQPTNPPNNSPRQGGCCFGKGKPAPKTTETVVTVANPVIKDQPIVASPAGHWNIPGKFTVGAPTEYKAMPSKEEGSK
jgi:hypothetical protein